VSTHISAEPGQIAPHVLMPGDPLRARWIAETFLDDPVCYNEVRGMLGYTGTWRGHPVSVQGSGMGLPSLSIYVNELLEEYGVRTLVRVGSCGALTEDLGLRDLVIASGACTDSSMNRVRFEGLDYAPVADFGLLRAAHDAALSRELPVATRVGLIFSGDSFYNPYTLAARHKARALAICTVSDHIVTGEHTSSAEREQTFTHMVEIALEAMLGA
jgi:purine-nucleoside phosphorylase